MRVTSSVITLLLLGPVLACAREVKLTAVDHFAIAVSAHQYEEARRLLASGADPNGLLADGATPLFVAAHGTDLESVRFLLENGADPNKPVPEYEDWTPIMAAAKQSSPEVILELLRHGADPSHKDRFKQTALTIAQGRGDAAVLTTLASGMAGQE